MVTLQHPVLSLFFIASMFVIVLYFMYASLMTAELALALSLGSLSVLVSLWKHNEVRTWVKAHQIKGSKPTTQQDIAKFLLHEHGSITNNNKEDDKSHSIL